MNAGKRDSANAFPMSFEQKSTLKDEIDIHTYATIHIYVFGLSGKPFPSNSNEH